jgi:UDP-N-acetylmuramoyl-L-alanyl-D-glutamate--2,6-diaminopimelate ligase
MLKIHPDHLVKHLQALVNSAARISADSRQIHPGDIFFAYSVGHGNALRDGRQFIDAAFEKGAAYIVFDPVDTSNRYEHFIDHPQCVAVENLGELAGGFCSEWYGNPSKQLNVIGVTGTNGKTSVTQWLAKSLDSPSHRTAVLGTLGTGFPGAVEKTGYTTPDAPKLQTQLKELLDSGAKQVAMEVSSHALDQNRIAGTTFDCAVFTNLTQDHLDYHGTMANYAQAKAKLFAWPGLQHAVINLDDAFGRELAMNLLARDAFKVWGYALNKTAFQGFEKFGDRIQKAYLSNSSLTHSGYDATFVLEGKGQVAVNVPLLGEFNLSNALAVWTTLLTQDFGIDEAGECISQLQPVIGRMELITFSKNAKSEGLLAVVDYAHTPDALQKTLNALRPIAEQRGGKIWCVFGCGGDRDPGKRSQMGAVAEQFADQIVITSDNPRSEDPLQIIQMIRQGIKAPGSNVQEIPDRAAAIMAAIRHADVRDIVLVAGKGHETTQEIGDKRFDFSDQEHIRLAAGGLV